MSDRQQQKLNELYLDYLPRADALGIEYINRYQEFISQPTIEVVNETREGLTGGDAGKAKGKMPRKAAPKTKRD